MTLPLKAFREFAAALGLGELKHVGEDEEDEEVEEEGEVACTAFANSLTSFFSPCTLREVPMMMRRSGLRLRSADSILPMSSPSGWASSYRTMPGRSEPTLRARAERATLSFAVIS